ncbi:MAG: DUF1667 domain-containing protein [Coriobacteriaceae bacterium]|jgi:CxxC motif-containing protein|nr:DUF1667 domain-containing protein [Coriobacteriaceae bacterium]
MQFAEETKILTCILCPFGCQLEVAFKVDVPKPEIVEVNGNRCKRGQAYAVLEATDPRRMVTSFVCVPGSLEPLSVKTAAPVPKSQVKDILAAIQDIKATMPVAIGEVLLQDVCGTGVDVVATKTLKKKPPTGGVDHETR